MQGVEYFYSAEEVATLLAVKEPGVTHLAASAVGRVERLTRQRVARQVRRLWIWVAVMVAGLAFTAGVVVQHQTTKACSAAAHGYRSVLQMIQTATAGDLSLEQMEEAGRLIDRTQTSQTRCERGGR